MHAVTADSHRFALDLHALLVDLDKARVRQHNPTARLEAIREQLTDLLDHTWPDDSVRSIQQALSEIARLLSDTAPEATWARARFRALSYGVLLLRYRRPIDDSQMTTLGQLALDHTLAAPA